MFAVKLVNFSMFTVSGENTVKCLKGFSWKPHSLLALLKSPMNFEPVLKGAVAVVSFCTHAQQHSGRPGEYWVPVVYFGFVQTESGQVLYTTALLQLNQLFICTMMSSYNLRLGCG